MSAGPIERAGDGVRLHLKATPKAAADRLGGVVDDQGARARSRRLAVRVTAPPADGAANAAVLKLLAKALSLRKTSLTLISGAASRHKVVHVAGDPDRLTAEITARLGLGS
ncbi:MAG: DUF167 family protein [Marivibrio sp.]|uniref:DUF167 domain-containing protein n=1 Tax=Marivibrio sp. TaxID=2039719 RepID=UPI0032EC389F